MKRISIIPLLLIPLLAVAKPGYKITLQVDGCKDSAVLMGYYMAQDRYVIDTAYNNGRGKFVFKGDNELLPGLYFFTNNTDRFVEFAVYSFDIYFDVSLHLAHLDELFGVMDKADKMMKKSKKSKRKNGKKYGEIRL